MQTENKTSEEIVKEAYERELIEAHRKSVSRVSASTTSLLNSYAFNGNNFKEAIISAMCSMGGVHAPIEQIYNMFNEKYEPDKMKIIPGFGSSFVKGQPDRMLHELNMLTSIGCNLGAYELMRESLEKHLHGQGKKIYANLAFYTAVYFHAFKINISFAFGFIVEARMKAWMEIIQKEFHNG